MSGAPVWLSTRSRTASRLLQGHPLASGRVGVAPRRSAFNRLLSAQLQALARKPAASPRPDGAGTGFQPLIQTAARRYGLDPALISALIEVESGFDPRAASPSGAKGLMQLMDETAASLGVSDPFDPVQNVMAGARLLRQLLERYRGDVRLALAAYNAGAGAVDRHGGVPPYAETQAYVSRVLGAVNRYRGASASF